METSVERRIYSAGKTFLCFIIFLICIQPLFLCYVVVSLTRLLWRNFLIVKNQHLTFVKKDNLRTFSYTPRNPGIVNIILHLQGDLDIDAIRESISRAVLQRKTKSGDLMFPKLVSNLVTCWGYYAWKMNLTSFNVDNHITIHPAIYRGRAVTESNVQDYISNIVSKYMPSNVPPWQICVIPMAMTATAQTVRSNEVRSPVAEPIQSNQNGCSDSEPMPSTSFDQATNRVEEEPQQSTSSESSTPRAKNTEHYYVVVRMHHLLLSEEPNLRLSDLLAIDSSITTSILNGRGELDLDRQIPKSPLTNILQYPVYIPQLCMRLQVGLTNCWNEFISKYDPYVGKSTHVVTSPTASTSAEYEQSDENKYPPVQRLPIETLTQLFGALLISYVTIVHDFQKGFYATKHHPMIKLKYLNNLINREVRKRNISWECIWNAMCSTLNPIRITKSAVEWIGWTGVAISILMPHLLFRELQAFRYCFFMGHVGFPGTLIGFLFAYIPLMYNALKEAVRLAGVFVQAPRFIYEELIEIHRSDEHILRNISLCGRKVLSWSKKISVNDVHRACIKHNVSPTELYMSAASATLLELLDQFDKVPVPKQIRVFATHHHHDYLLGRLNNNDSQSGHLCLILPMENVTRRQLKQIRQNFATARENQVGIYFLFLLHKRFNVLTKFLPAVWTVIIFNYLSRRFSVSITEVTKNGCLFQQRAAITCWNHTVLDALFFSPPQSNGSVSLSIQQFGDHIQLGVITDAQIHPHHTKLSEGWTKNLEKLF